MGDSGYRDKARAAAYAMEGVLLLTPDTGWAQARGVLGTACGVTARHVSAWKPASRQTAMEPVFDVLSQLLSTTGLHKPLPQHGYYQRTTCKCNH